MGNQTEKFQTSKRQIQTAIPVVMEMAVRDIDWKRIYRKIGEIPNETSIFQVLAGVAWGISGSSFLSLFSRGQDTPVSFYVTVGVATAIVGGLSFVVGKGRSDIIKSSCQEVLRDMLDVYKTCFPGESLESGGD